MTEFIINSDQLERLIEAVEHDTGREINRVVIDGVRAAEIVRCRNCKHSDRSYWCKRWGMLGDLPSITPDGFCAWGERAEDE